MINNNIEPKFVIDELYNRICARMRKQGVKLNKCNEENYSSDIDEVISTVSCIISEQLYHDIQKGGLG